jgi:hypothetical protein
MSYTGMKVLVSCVYLYQWVGERNYMLGGQRNY